MTDDVFRTGREDNGFDRMSIDVPGVYARHPIGTADTPKPGRASDAQSPFHALYRAGLVPLAARRRLSRVAREIGLDTAWFQEFSGYWSSVLGGRPLWSVHDFFFLKNLYRVRFQDNRVPDTDSPHTHVEAWQRPELLYQLLHLVAKESVRDELPALVQLFKYKKRVRSLLEFGCATAPVTTSLFQFFRPDDGLKVYLSDIQTLAFHYGCYKFRQRSNVEPVLLRPEHDCLLRMPEPVDAIFCQTVFEHLNKPLETAHILYEALNPGGVLVFDYIKSQGAGLDTLHAVREREAVLDYIAGHFELPAGPIAKGASVGLTVARRR